MDFFKDLEQQLEPRIDKILNHPFLKRLEDGWLDKKQLKYFATQYSVYCQYFPRFLAATAANIPDDTTRFPIMENMWEEHGSGDMSQSHRTLFNNFAKSVGMTQYEIDHAEPLPTTRICVENLINLCKDGHFLESLGALGPGTEFFTTDEYTIIEKGLKTYDFLSPKDYEFWTIHIGLDDEHYSEMIDSMRPWAVTVENKFIIKAGAKRAIDLEILFWDGLEDNLPGK